MEGGQNAPDAATDGGSARAHSVLESVVVHAAGAVCVRRARLVGRSLQARDGGAITVRVDGLPPTLRAGSLRGSVRSGPSGLRVADIRIDVGASLRREEEAPGLRFDLEDAEDRQSRLRDRRDRLAAEIEEVAGFRAEAPQPRRGDPPRWAPVESILALAGFVDARLAVLHGRLRSVEDDLEQAAHDTDVLRHRLEQSSTALPTGWAEVSVSAVLTLVREMAVDPTDPAPSSGDQDGALSTDAGPGPHTDRHADSDTNPDPHTDPAEDREDAQRSSADVELELEYHVSGATWSPVYQLRLDSRSGAGTLVLRASVAQRTGEDWSGVRLGLSTADLLRRADLPELRSLRIGRAQQEPAGPAWREPPLGLAELFADYDAAVQPSEPRAPHRAQSAVRAMTRALPVATVPPPAPTAPAAPAAGWAPHTAMAPGAVASGAAPAPGGSEAQDAGASADRLGYGAAPASAEPLLRSARAKQHPAAAPQPPTPPTAAAPPSAELLDYAGLVLAGPQQPGPRGALRPAAAEPDSAAAEFRRLSASVALDRPAHAVDVRVSAGSFDYRFDTPAAVDVGADGRRHHVPVGEVAVRTEFGYVCVPAQDTSVFGTVLVTNTSAQPLLAGPADVVVDGDFVRTAPLPTLAPGQRQAVGIGVAESVQVARRTRMRESTAGLRGGTTVLDHTVEVEVANRLPYPAVVEVRERIPTSADKDVRIEEHRSEPRWTDPGEPLDGADGAYVPGARVWRVTLEPGRTATLTGGFEIRLPVGKSVVGGNRRN